MKRRKRENGAGTAFQLKGRDDWTAEVTLGYDRHGKRIYKRKSGFRTRMEALDYIPTMRQSFSEANIGITVREVFEIVMARFEGSEATVKQYRMVFNRALAMVADYPVKHLQPMDWQRILDLMKHDGFSSSYRSAALSVIRMINRQAVLEGAIEQDRSSAVRVGRHDRKLYHVALDDDEIKQHLVLADAGDEDAMIACILIFTGMRANELFTLPSASYNRDGRFFVGGSKTASGRNRIIPLASRILPYVEHFASKDQEKLIGIAYITFQKRLITFYKRTGLTVHTAHDFRRTFATRMKTVDAPDADKTAIIGHANIEMTKYYQDSRAEELRNIVENMWQNT